MNYNTENIYIRKCLTLIEMQFNRGKSADWTSYDFEKLGDAILEKTGVTLSVTTLKRIWGKLPYNNIPATTTLNTLAQFLEYKDWRDFKQQDAIVPVQKTIAIPKANRKWLYWVPGLLGLFIIVYLLSSGKTVHTGTYTFSSNKVIGEGVPNSVIFKYNATTAGTDSVFISQTWDTKRKVAVSKDRRKYSSIYYYPGHFRAKLIVGNQIVKEHDLLINSGGWVVAIDNEEVDEIPIYLKKEEFQRDNVIEVDEKMVHSYNLTLQPRVPSLRFFNVLELEGIKTDSFAFETSVKSDFREGSAVCQQVEILLLCKNDVIIIPLCAKACIGDLNLYVAGKAVSSKDADLSKFGSDLSQWVKLRVEARNRHIRFLVNGEEAYALDFPHPPADIIGVQYNFHGVGAVKNTRFMLGTRTIDL